MAMKDDVTPLELSGWQRVVSADRARALLDGFEALSISEREVMHLLCIDRHRPRMREVLELVAAEG